MPLVMIPDKIYHCIISTPNICLMDDTVERNRPSIHYLKNLTYTTKRKTIDLKQNITPNEELRLIMLVKQGLFKRTNKSVVKNIIANGKINHQRAFRFYKSYKDHKKLLVKACKAGLLRKESINSYKNHYIESNEKRSNSFLLPKIESIKNNVISNLLIPEGTFIL